ncbi:MAG: TPM domain-containing protein [Bdellovibrio sp.]
MEAGNTQVKSQVPPWLRSNLSESEFQQVEKVVQEVELKTHSEIVPIVVRNSTPLRGARLACVVAFVAVTAIIDLAFFQEWGWWTLGLVQVVGLVLGVLATRSRVLLELFIPDSDEWKCVHERAELEFYRLGIQKTKDRSGILIFVSMFEHKVVVLADEGIAKKLKPQMWDEAVENLTRSLRERQLALGLTQAIKSFGDVLQVHFPAGQNNQDELKNTLVLKE